MRRIWVIVAILVILVGIIPVAGCSSTTKIGDIQANPTRYEGKQVNLKGTVGDTFWLAVLDKGAYQLGDGTGTIWIVTTQPPPQKGVQIATKGTVFTLVKIGERNLGTVIMETKRG